jgi:hypothetical protein
MMWVIGEAISNLRTPSAGGSSRAANCLFNKLAAKLGVDVMKIGVGRGALGL